MRELNKYKKKKVSENINLSRWIFAGIGQKQKVLQPMQNFEYS